LEVRQTGLVIGLRFDHPQGGMLMTKALHGIGVWAMFAGFDPSALQLKPGLLMDDQTADQVLARLDQAIETLPAGSAS
jgi:acetylornithine/succinyldiaminopimelate/putrescine aminotransferase